MKITLAIACAIHAPFVLSLFPAVVSAAASPEDSHISHAHSSAFLSNQHRHVRRAYAAYHDFPKDTTDLPRSEESEALSDIQTVAGRRRTYIAQSVTNAKSIANWTSTLGADGKWPDSEINYATGCKGTRANWPAQTHWKRIVTMAAAWRGGPKNSAPYTNNPELLASTSLAMDYWFSNDFTNPACVDSGDTAACPCTEPGFWNSNWYSNIILIPGLVGQACLTLNETLSPTQVANCTHFTVDRSFGTFNNDTHGYLVGANTLDVATIGIDGGLLQSNASLVADAYSKIHNELVIQDGIRIDGIKPDGSFGQHGGVLYNGNYGKDYTNDVLDVEVNAGGTQFAANDTSKDAFATLIDGDQWMIYQNILTGVLHWDYSVVGRMISFPVIDAQATQSIKINVSAVKELGELWSSSVLVDTADSLSTNSSSANVGDIRGNRMFYSNDYMVHRGPGYVTTVKMFSNRTENSECVNAQNPLGFHLSDGAVHTYLQGNEYEDIAAAWDWNLIPGTTVDYSATPLNCDNTKWGGVESFVGGASTGKIGVAAMRYTNPYTKSLSWQKAWFFLADDVQHVMISNVSSLNASVPVFSVLDQRLHTGDVLVDGHIAQPFNYTAPQSLYHGGVGYKFEHPVELSVDYGNRTGNWSALGISTQPPPITDLFSAWIDHTTGNGGAPISYSVYPGVDNNTFFDKIECSSVQTAQNDAEVSAVFDESQNVYMVVFWNAKGGVAWFNGDGEAAPLVIAASGNAAIIYEADTGNVTVSDPSQTLQNIQVNIAALGKPPVSLDFTLPSGGKAGSSVSQNVEY